MKAWKHFVTITQHKLLVMKGCFYVGLYWQGLTHDLSKYMPSEFRVGAKYYQGVQSPNNAERLDIGYSTAWLHHKGRNKHHYEYWLDYSSREGGKMIPARMPQRYMLEMFIDRVAASKNYNKENYSDDMPLKYYENGNPTGLIHEETQRELEFLLHMLADEGEKRTFDYIKYDILRNHGEVGKIGTEM